MEPFPAWDDCPHGITPVWDCARCCPPGPEPGADFRCCTTWIEYPTEDQPRKCPECGSVFIVKAS